MHVMGRSKVQGPKFEADIEALTVLDFLVETVIRIRQRLGLTLLNLVDRQQREKLEYRGGKILFLFRFSGEYKRNTVVSRSDYYRPI